jgi:solute carrier family 8 (sodium/calcium exchanger)
VTIVNDDDFQSMMNKMMSLTNANVDKLKVTRESWGTQVSESLNVNGGDVENATTSDYVMHIATFGWKVIYTKYTEPYKVLCY